MQIHGTITDGMNVLMAFTFSSIDNRRLIIKIAGRKGEQEMTEEDVNTKSWHEIFMADADEYSKQLKDKERNDRR